MATKTNKNKMEIWLVAGATIVFVMFLKFSWVNDNGMPQSSMAQDVNSNKSADIKTISLEDIKNTNTFGVSEQGSDVIGSEATVAKANNYNQQNPVTGSIANNFSSESSEPESAFVSSFNSGSTSGAAGSAGSSGGGSSGSSLSGGGSGSTLAGGGASGTGSGDSGASGETPAVADSGATDPATVTDGSGQIASDIGTVAPPTNTTPDAGTPPVPDVTVPPAKLPDTNSILTSNVGNNTTNLAAELSILSPLPKVHYSWPIPDKLINDRQSETAYQLARITHSLCVAGEWVTKTQVDNCVYICAKINKTEPQIPCSIGINYSPWHRKFMLGTDFETKYYNGAGDCTIFTNSTYQDEINYFVSRLTLVRQWVSESNKKYGADVKVGAIMLDSERFGRSLKDEKWNEAMSEALNAIHKKAVALFPEARIEWYGRGIWRSDGVTFSRTIYFTGKEIMPTLSCSLYTLSDMEGMRQLFKKTCELADSYSVKEVTPWVALASGYKPDPVKLIVWTWDWDYNLQNSYTMGAELNDLCVGTRPAGYPSYDRAKIVIFFPDPFNSQVPSWDKHFIAYCKGAASANK